MKFFEVLGIIAAVAVAVALMGWFAQDPRLQGGVQIRSPVTVSQPYDTPARHQRRDPAYGNLPRESAERWKNCLRRLGLAKKCQPEKRGGTHVVVCRSAAIAKVAAQCGR